MHKKSSSYRPVCSITATACYVLTAWTALLGCFAIAALVWKWWTAPDPALAQITQPIATQASKVTSQQDEQQIKPLGASRQQLNRPRTVEEMISESESSDPLDSPENARSLTQESNPSQGNSAASGLVGLTPPPLQPFSQDAQQPINQTDEEDGETSISNVTDDFINLIREARYAQIEGDIRRSLIKLEQADEISPDHPVVNYYFGLAYEFLRNAPKSREYFAKVITKRDQTSKKLYDLATLHLERGFDSPADRRGDMCFGSIMEYYEPDAGSGERVVLTIPVMMKDGLNIRLEDISVLVLFYNAVNGKSIVVDRVGVKQKRWLNEPANWADGEEIMEATYQRPALTQEELAAYGDLKYYGHTVKLYYKNEPMDCYASPPVLLLIEQMKQNKSIYNGLDGYDNLLPPVDDAQPMSDFMDPGYPGQVPDDDAGLLPVTE